MEGRTIGFPSALFLPLRIGVWDLGLIVITGVPGSGKSELCELLARRLSVPCIHLNDLLIQLGLYSSYDEETKSYVIDVDRAREEIKRALNLERGVVEGHLAQLIIPRDAVEICFVLRLSPYELERRLKERGYEEAKVRENCSAEVLDVILAEALENYGEEVVSEINVTGKDREAIIEEMLAVLKGEHPKKVRIVNWLGFLVERGELNRFLT